MAFGLRCGSYFLAPWSDKVTHFPTVVTIMMIRKTMIFFTIIMLPSPGLGCLQSWERRYWPDPQSTSPPPAPPLRALKILPARTLAILRMSKILRMSTRCSEQAWATSALRRLLRWKSPQWSLMRSFFQFHRHDHGSIMIRFWFGAFWSSWLSSIFVIMEKPMIKIMISMNDDTFAGCPMERSGCLWLSHRKLWQGL